MSVIGWLLINAYLIFYVLLKVIYLVHCKPNFCSQIHWIGFYLSCFYSFCITVIDYSFAIEIEAVLLRCIVSVCYVSNEYVFMFYYNFSYLYRVNFSSQFQKSNDLDIESSICSKALPIAGVILNYHY
jgi:hypothetical protein